MSQIGRDQSLFGSRDRVTHTLLGVVREFHIENNSGPSPERDHMIVEVVSDPFNSGDDRSGQLIRLFVRPQVKAGQSSGLLVEANSVHGLSFGHGTRRPVVHGQVCAFEKCILLPNGDIQAEFVKSGAGPEERLNERGVSFPDAWATVLPPRIFRDNITQVSVVALLDATVVCDDLRDIEHVITGIVKDQVTPNGKPHGWPGFLLLSRRLPSREQDNEEFYASPSTRLASLIVMSGRPGPQSTPDRPSFQPMHVSEAIAMIDAKQLALPRVNAEGAGWRHEVVPLRCFPMAETAMPVLQDGGRTKGFDRSILYQFYDREAPATPVKVAGTGFAQSVVMTQCSRKTGSWITIFTHPTRSKPVILPFFETVTPQTPPGHIAACRNEVKRLLALRKEASAEMANEKSSRGPRPQQMAAGF